MNPELLFELREAYRIVNNFFTYNHDKIFICRDSRVKKNLLGDYYLATADDVLKSGFEVMAVLNKEDRLTNKIFDQTKDKTLASEVKEIILAYFNEDEADLVDYASFIPFKEYKKWMPWFGLKPQFEENRVEIEVNFPVLDYEGEVDEWTAFFTFEKFNNRWVLTECPDDYEPKYIQKNQDLTDI